MANGNIDKVRITVTFATPPGAVTVIKAPLKYNKLFAFSCQLDDGGRDIYTHGFPFLNGGTVEGTTYPGLVYTDGCGNDIKFKMSSSVFSFDDTETIDVHQPGTGWSFLVTWPELAELYQAGWGISNHGLTNQTGDYEYSVERNHSYLKLRTQAATPWGVRMGIFINPNGDTSFTEYAFQNGYLACFSQRYSFGYPGFDVTSGWDHSNIRMGRTNFYTGVSISAIADSLSARSKNGAHQWGVVFSHSITNSTYGYDFATFQTQMSNIAGKHGKTGQDDIWMTIEEEVLDYLLLGPFLKVHTGISGNDLVITFSGTIPAFLRFYASTLQVNGASNIQSVKISGPGQITFNGTGSENSMININWQKTSLLPDTSDPQIADAETWVSRTEIAPNQKNANVATDYVYILDQGPDQDGFRRRLCALPGLTYPPYFCNVGVGEHHSSWPEIYPNPSDDVIRVRSPFHIEKIALYSSAGQAMHEETPCKSETLIPVRSFPEGLYYFRIITGERMFFRKLIISR